MRAADEIGARELHAAALGGIGACQRERRNLSESRDNLATALTLAREVGHREYEAEILAELALLEKVEADTLSDEARAMKLADASGHLEEAVNIFREIGHAGVERWEEELSGE